MKRAEIEALADSLRHLLAAISAGELSASGATRHRLEGALAAVEAVLGEGSSLLPRLGLDSK
jgi:hypothetical protein